MTTSFGPYTLLGKLATGGMAEVWLARKTGLAGVEQELVVKRILPHLSADPTFVELFLNEARLASRFTHPNIAQIFDVGVHDGSYFIAMELVDGKDLGQVLRAHGKPLPVSLALRIVADAAQGLHYAHTRTSPQGKALEVVHRDVSPQNLLISFEGTTKVVDFGIARAAGQASTTQEGAVRGKLHYMAPEQGRGDPLDARTDLYALGLVLYEALTGVRPLKRSTDAASLGAVLEPRFDPPSALAPIPRPLDELVLKALKRDPAERYQSGRDFHRALEEFLLTTRQLATTAEVEAFLAQLFPDRGHQPDLSARAATPAMKAASVATPARPASSEETKALSTARPPTPARPTFSSSPAGGRAATTAAAPPNIVVYRHTVEAFINQVLVRKGLLSAALTERLKPLGIDPTKPRDVEIGHWWKFIEITAEVVAPKLAPEDAYREVGREMVRGFEASFVGKTSFMVLRMLGHRRAVTKLAESFRSADNSATIEILETRPSSARIRMSIIGGFLLPTYTEGVLLEGLQQLGAKGVQVKHQRDSVGAVIFDFSWS